MCLNFKFDLPADIEEQIRTAVRDLDVEAKEAFLGDLFRRGVLSHYDLSRALGIDRFETDAWLKRKNIYEGSPTHEDVEADLRTLDRLLGKDG